MTAQNYLRISRTTQYTLVHLYISGSPVVKRLMYLSYFLFDSTCSELYSYSLKITKSTLTSILIFNISDKPECAIQQSEDDGEIILACESSANPEDVMVSILSYFCSTANTTIK